MSADRQAVTEERVDVPGADNNPRVMIISTVYRLTARVRNYVRGLLNEGVWVDLVFLEVGAWADADPEGWAEVRDHPRLTVHTIDGAEQRHPLRRVERVLVHKAPRAVLNRASRLTGRVKPLRPLHAPALVLEKGHRKVAGAFHKRVYIKGYRLVRSSVLAKLFRQRLADVDFSTVDRVVAADVYAVTLGAQLARRHPHVVATTSLERGLGNRPQQQESGTA